MRKRHAMNAILIKPQSKKMYSIIMKVIKETKTPVKILSEREEDDELLIARIEKSMESGAAPKQM